MEKVSKTSHRKDEHLIICLEKEVESSVSAGFEKIRIKHQALPELDYKQVDTSTTFLGKQLAAPILISSMTGGSAEGGRFNALLAETAEHFKIAMGVGSQRAAIENPALEASFQVRDIAPSILLFANLGAVQLNYSYGIDQVRRAVDMIQADALYLHLNPLQEALQPEGNSNFTGLFSKIEKVCASLEVPVFVKEVGSGINPHIAKALLELGVTGIDCAGLGGTSWALVEAERQPDPAMRHLAQQFGHWGLPTVDCLLGYRQLGIDGQIIASGGIRSGFDVFKSIALGANLAGMALPFIRSANKGPEALHSFTEGIIKELRIAMFNAHCSTISDIDFSTISLED